MSYLKYSGQYLKSAGSFISGITPPVGNAANFAGASYLDLSGDPDLSGNKIIKWKMYLDPGFSGTLFYLGANLNNAYAYFSGTNLQFGNFDISNPGSQRIISMVGFTGKELICTASKTTNYLSWLSVNGYEQPNTGGAITGEPNPVTSRIGAFGRVAAENILSNAYVWDIEVVGIGAWGTFGNTANTNAAWVDTIGSNDGTFNILPSIADLTFSTPDFDDYFLPSQDELYAMYTELYLEAVGDFSAAVYWSSTEVSSTNAMATHFGTDSTISVAKTSLFSVRAARKFTAGIGAYALRDTGPAGGLIFHIDGGTIYYEAAPEDSITADPTTNGAIWSNITSVATTATGSAIGTGSTNTPLIVGQANHELGAAWLCTNYEIYL